MKKLLFIVISIALLFNYSFGQQAVYDIGSIVTKIELPNSYGQVIDLSKDVEKGLCIIFTNHQCQYAQLYEERIASIDEQYKALGIKLVAIESKIDSFEGSTQSLTDYLEINDLPYQYVIDIDNSVSKQFGAESSPHAFLLEKTQEGLVLRYAGSIDNNSRKPERASHKYLQNAMESIVNGKSWNKTRTKAIGCTIDKG